MSKKTHVCGHCGKRKPLTEYHWTKIRDQMRHHSICKPCRSAYNSAKYEEWKKKNPERYAETQARYLYQFRKTHKLYEIKGAPEKGYTKCGAKPVKVSYFWEQVDCGQCLQHKPKENV